MDQVSATIFILQRGAFHLPDASLGFFKVFF